MFSFFILTLLMGSVSVSSSITTMRLKWINKSDYNMNRTAIKMRSSPTLEFTVSPPVLSQRIFKGGVGSYQVLRANFTFRRRLVSSLVNTYIPSFLVTSMSWVSFWLDPDAVPGRVTLGVTAILTLTTQIVSSRGYLPVLDYMTALDAWLFGCLVMVFLSLIEFTLANTLQRKNSKVGLKS